MFLTEVEEKIETHSLCSMYIYICIYVYIYIYILNRVIYEIMWKNIIQSGRPQMTYNMAHAHCVLGK